MSHGIKTSVCPEIHNNLTVNLSKKNMSIAVYRVGDTIRNKMYKTVVFMNCLGKININITIIKSCQIECPN